MNQVQKTYKEAQERMNKAEAWRKTEEAAYIMRHEIKNEDGTIPELLEDVDNEVWVKDFWECVAPKNLTEELSQAQDALKKAGDDLIFWGLTEIPEEKTKSIRNSIEPKTVRRNNAIEFLMKYVE
jgi:hypothetical protein